MTEQELHAIPFYFCDLKTGDQECDKKDTCKRYVFIKDLDYKDYKNYPFARLNNVCKRTNYKMYLKVDDVQHEDSNNQIKEQ